MSNKSLLFMKAYTYVGEIYESKDCIYLEYPEGNLNDILFDEFSY